MKTPIIVNDSPNPNISGDLTVFETVEMAEQSRETYDVGDPGLQYFDSEGLLLKLVPVSDRKRVKLIPAENEPTHQLVLIALLKDFLSKVGSAESNLDMLSLNELIRLAQ